MGIYGNPNQHQSCFGRTRFPALGNSFIYLFRILICSSCCLHLLRLARVIALVLVLRNLVRDRSVIILFSFFRQPTLTVVQTEGLGIPEGSLRRKQQMKIANNRIIRRTTPPILQRKTKTTKSLIKLYYTCMTGKY